MEKTRKIELFRKGVVFFNQEKFYESHEEIEEIWLKEKGPDKKFLQGLIITAGGFCHIQKKRFYPAYKALSKALVKLEEFDDIYYSMNLKFLKSQVQIWVDFLIEENCDYLKDKKISSSLWPHFPRIDLIKD